MKALLMIFMLSFALAGCTHAPAATVSNWPGEEAAIRAELQRSEDGWNSGSLERHLSIYVDNMTQMTRQGPRAGIAGIREAFSQGYFAKGAPEQRLSTRSVVVRRLDDGAALVTGNFILSGGGKPEQSGWFTLVWVKTAAGWRVVHDHSS